MQQAYYRLAAPDRRSNARERKAAGLLQEALGQIDSRVLTVDTTGAPKITLKDSTGHTAWTAPEPLKH